VPLRRAILPATSAIQLSPENLVRTDGKRALHDQYINELAGTGFSADDGASLLMAFRGLQQESVAQGQAHNNIAKELTTLVADPFDDWAQSYKVRI